jgi:phosphopantetheinyl transferase
MPTHGLRSEPIAVTVWLVGLDWDRRSSEELAAGRSRVARAALRTVLAELTGKLPSEIAFEADLNGKPILPGGPHFSVSHSEGWALIAVCESAPVGVDLEAVPALGSFERVSRWAYTAHEQQVLAAMPVDDRAEAFCRIWVVKEACVKEHGTGVPLLPGIETDGALGGSVVASGEHRKWLVRSWSPRADYWAAVAVSRRPGQHEFLLERLDFARFSLPDLTG